MIRPAPLAPGLFAPALLVASVLIAGPAFADDRTYTVGSFDRVRIDAPLDVRIVTGTSPGASVTGDRAVVDRLRVELNGTRLVVRMGMDGWGEVPKSAIRTSTIVTLRTPQLVAVVVNGGAKVAVDRMIAQRIDLALSGSGVLAVARIEADQVNAAVGGAGTMTLSGRVRRATLILTGAGAIEAGKLDTADLVAGLDGTGAIAGNARATARITSSGLGHVDIAGAGACTIVSTGGGPVTCASRR